MTRSRNKLAFGVFVIVYTNVPITLQTSGIFKFITAELALEFVLVSKETGKQFKYTYEFPISLFYMII